MTVKSSVKWADGGKGTPRMGAFADVRVRTSRDSSAEEKRSAEEHRRSVAYGRARGHLQ